MRPLLSAAILSVGSELTTGETRDTNAGDLARDLTEAGVEVRSLAALPDDRAAIQAAIAGALADADLVVLTGGLGPTPDDLTRESIAAFVGETPAVDPGLERWLAELFERRRLPFVEANRKQAWLIPAATSIPNDHGTAPGWWVDRPDGRVVVALPGPPREMHPMWSSWVRSRLDGRGLGRPLAVVTLRSTGIGESLIADRLGPLLDRGREPLVATYARAEAVDVRISAFRRDGFDADAAVAETAHEVERQLAGHLWARGTTTWAEALGTALDEAGWSLGLVEVGTRGAVARLLGEGLGPRLAFAEVLPHRPAPHAGARGDSIDLARRVRAAGPADVGLAVEARPRRGDTATSIAVVDPLGEHRERRLVFLSDEIGRGRVAVAAAGILLARLRR